MVALLFHIFPALFIPASVIFCMNGGLHSKVCSSFILPVSKGKINNMLFNIVIKAQINGTSDPWEMTQTLLPIVPILMILKYLHMINAQ